MNLTIAVDRGLVERARDVARMQGRCLKDLIREYLQTVVGDQPGAEVADELLELMDRHGGHSGGARFRRADAYEGHV
jgi:hypothetical protein